MPGMPVFQDSPSQLKGQIYVLKGANVAPLEVDTSGNLTVAGNVGLTTGTTVGLATGTNSIGTVGLEAGTNTIGTVDLATGAEVALATGTTVGLTTGTTVGLEAGTNTIGTVDLATGAEVALATGTTVGLTTGTTVGLEAGTNTIGTVDLATGAEVALVTGTTVGLTTGTTVGLIAGTNVIGKVQNALVFTNVDSFGAGTVLTSKDVGINAIVEADSQDISLESSYNWFIKNTGTTSSAQDITLKVELSPDGIIWIEDTGVAVSVPFNTSKMITVNNFLKNARFVITGGTAATTVISCFQAQH